MHERPLLLLPLLQLVHTASHLVEESSDLVDNWIAVDEPTIRSFVRTFGFEESFDINSTHAFY